MKTTFRHVSLAGLIAIGSAGLLTLNGDAASAQSGCILDCRDKGWSFSQCNRYCQTRYGEPNYNMSGPRVYGYTSGSGYMSGGRGGCGEYRYMRGGMCVDARTNPPR